ncbi:MULTISPECIES: energy-coupling factor transporter transmembrane protein EcfT [unclassified Corynebacterium]|uniref:energy-coupling factor transporter transmembrane component T family protein n=1 Tax=unclassified Corynebacterium TaxID=2624378 RepID=UPI0029CA3EC3|nr:MULTISPECIES: energy-coupling factor transporter transmembrane protein EcfT [unclassified Corynebacterium]WPF65270.1 energy-coupling factor transporter transmembrane protein EcfT [Corynebacterium sp. 22KM0430]WPF67765.1 energy-coupling factor transporter transmembrane protein EcfT [Corynebacterium sp. 21KM1197]
MIPRAAMTPLGTYIPGHSPVHRAGVGLKLLAVLGYVLVGVFAVPSVPAAALYVLPCALCYALARIPLSVAWSQLWPPLPILLFLGAFQWWQRDLEHAAVLVITLSASLMAASLLTLTTTIADLMEGLERGLAPLARLGFPAERFSLALSLTLRMIPVQMGTVGEVLEARKARGASWSAQAFITPVLIRSLNRAQAIAEALWARGAGDQTHDETRAER